ncbi:FAD/NAD(P)-binding domain-containing protein [Penicillium cf. viridicatum]|uniref:FAD/NAD(P)-binding domain-containing protein n=1 Tax=Penicillium cf. viridicatum TaxID=2972119 RepID=A0A9W9MH94_9EURO|nr:FAD/NAD(P)-binding domain-containing protein [Penicillium cf. viridicatum]
MTKDQPPVVVIGAGPVGCFIAYRLGKAGIPVRIFEKEPAVPYSPRAVGYYGATQVAFKDSGLYDLVRAEGFMTAGLCWRTPPIDDDQGGKRLGDMIAAQPLCDPGDPLKACPSGLLNLRQSELTKLVLQEALKTDFVTVQFNSELSGIKETENGVTVDFENKELSPVTGCYLVGADGGRSKTRKLTGTPCLGHTWPERLISTDVVLWNYVDPLFHTCYIIGTKNYTIMTPLADPVIGKKSLWRCTIAVPPEDQRPDEELLQEAVIRQFYEQVVSGPRPLAAEITAKAVYRIHQRLVPTMRKGRCVLAGDAAHMNNPYGAMGLNTGLLDGDALAESLIMILNEGRSDKILTSYSDARRKVFQYFVDPTTTANKLRLHLPSETAAVDDDCLRSLQNPTPESLKEGAKPYFETWRTDMRAVAEKSGL